MCIPVINCSHILQAENSRVRTDSTEAVSKALKAVGCFYLTEHSIPSSEIEDVLFAAESLFAMEAKHKAAIKAVHEHDRGLHTYRMDPPGIICEDIETSVERHLFSSWSTISLASNDQDCEGNDACEAFEVGSEPNPYNPNLWPPIDPNLRPKLTNLLVACHLLHARLMAPICSALGLTGPGGVPDSRVFEPDIRAADHVLRLLRAPAPEPAASARRARQASVSLLFRRPGDRLLLRERGGRLRPLPPAPAGAALVSAGDLLWSRTRGAVAPPALHLAPPDGPPGAAAFAASLLCRPGRPGTASAAPPR